ncbi:hypothetical protein ACU5AY_01885 [Rhizobium sp. PAMB 3174]
MSEDPKKAISEKIEDTIEGVLRFTVRMLRTTWTIFRHPRKCAGILLAADKSKRDYALPLTYLVIGGFVFSLTISAYPFGLLNSLDLIWFYDEISSNLYERWNEALSISGLLTATFPVFLSVTFITSLASHGFAAGDERRQFKTLCYYAFGYQALLFFFVFFLFIAFDIVGTAIWGPYQPPDIDPQLFENLTDALLVVLFVFFLSPLLMPAIMLTSWQFGNFRTSKTVKNGAVLAFMPLFALLGLLVISYSASLPAVYKNKVAEAKNAETSQE